MSTFTQLEAISKYILARPFLKNIFVPASNVFTNLAGYRKLGLKTEDLFMEENEVMATALRRIPADESYKRVFRIATAMQMSLTQQILPEKDWIKPEEDTDYLIPYLLEAEAQIKEREELDNLVVKPGH